MPRRGGDGYRPGAAKPSSMDVDRELTAGRAVEGKPKVTWGQAATASPSTSGQSSSIAAQPHSALRTAASAGHTDAASSRMLQSMQQALAQRLPRQSSEIEPVSSEMEAEFEDSQEENTKVSIEYDDGPEHHAAMAAAGGRNAGSEAASDIVGDQQGSRSPRAVVNLVDAAAKFREGLQPDPLQYIHHLEETHPKGGFPANLRPSVLDLKLKAGSHSYKDTLKPTWAADGLSFMDLQHDDEGQLVPIKSSWQFQLSLIKATNVGGTGYGQLRYPVRHVARMCIFDRQHHCFLGNVLPLLCTDVRGQQATWAFSPSNGFIVRCGQLQPMHGGGVQRVDPDKLSLYVELNVAFRLMHGDAGPVPEDEKKASKLSEELCTCWALINLRRCCELVRELEVAVPLYYGSIYDPQLLHALAAEQRRQHPIKTLFSSRAPPVLRFRVSPLPPEQPVVAYHHMPPTMIAHPHLAYALGAYRLMAAQHLAASNSPMATFGDAVLATFPQLLADFQLLHEFLLKWHTCCLQLMGDGRAPHSGHCSPVRSPPAPIEPASPARVVSAFQRCVLELVPLLECISLPVPHMANFVEYQEYRAAVIRKFCWRLDQRRGGKQVARDPVEPLSCSPGELLFKPFDVAETRLCLADTRQ